MGHLGMPRKLGALPTRASKGELLAVEWGLVHFQMTPGCHGKTVAARARCVFAAVRLQLKTEYTRPRAARAAF